MPYPLQPRRDKGTRRLGEWGCAGTRHRPPSEVKRSIRTAVPIQLPNPTCCTGMCRYFFHKRSLSYRLTSILQMVKKMTSMIFLMTIQSHRRCWREWFFDFNLLHKVQLANMPTLQSPFDRCHSDAGSHYSCGS